MTNSVVQILFNSNGVGGGMEGGSKGEKGRGRTQLPSRDILWHPASPSSFGSVVEVLRGTRPSGGITFIQFESWLFREVRAVTTTWNGICLRSPFP